MDGHYLDRPFVPLAVALPRMLAQIEAELSTATGPAEEQWLRQRGRFDPWTARAAADHLVHHDRRGAFGAGLALGRRRSGKGAIRRTFPRMLRISLGGHWR